MEEKKRTNDYERMTNRLRAVLSENMKLIDGLECAIEDSLRPPVKNPCAEEMKGRDTEEEGNSKLEMYLQEMIDLALINQRRIADIQGRVCFK